MTITTRTDARRRPLASLKAAHRRLGKAGVDFAALDIITVAAAFAADHIVQTCDFATSEAQAAIADTLRSQFVAQLAQYERLYFEGGERL